MAKLAVVPLPVAVKAAPKAPSARSAPKVSAPQLGPSSAAALKAVATKPVLVAKPILKAPTPAVFPAGKPVRQPVAKPIVVPSLTAGKPLLPTVAVAKAVVSDVPKELAGKGVVVTAGKQAIGALPSLADRAIASIAGHAIDQPGNTGLQRQAATAVGTDIPKELKGTGVVEKGLTVGGDLAANAIRSLKLPGNRSPGLQASGFAGPLAQNAAADLVDLPAEILPSTYYTVKAGVQAAEGKPQAAIAMGKSIAKSLTSIKGWEQHPLNNALMVSGGLSALGRVGEGALGAAGLKDLPPYREPETLYGHVTSPVPQYSRDPLIRLRQRVGDVRRTPLDETKPRIEQSLLPRAGEGHAARAAGRRATEEVERNFNIQQRHQQEVLKARQDAVTAPHRPGPQLRQLGRNAINPREPVFRPEIVGKEAVNLIAQGVIRRPDTVVQDLSKYRDMVASHAPKSTGDRLAQEATLTNIDNLLDDKRFLKNPQPAFTAANKFRADTGPLQQRLVEQGHITQAQADHAKLVPYARLHMDATHGETPQALAHDEAKKVVSAAQSKLARSTATLSHATPDELAGAHAVVEIDRKALEASRGVEKILSVAKDDRTATLGADGKPLTDEQIRAHMKSNGVTEPAFVSHRLGSRAQSMYGSLSKQALAETKERTGEAFASGRIDTSHEALVRQHLASQLLIDRHESTAHLLRTFGLHTPDGGYWKTWDQAVDAARDPQVRTALNVRDRTDLVPVKIAPQFVRSNQLSAIKGSIDNVFDENALTSPATPITDALAKPENPSKPGQYMLVGKDVADRIAKHEQPRNDFQKLMSGFTGQFVHTVLPLSAKRLVGLTQEQAIRMIVSHTGAASALTWRNFVARVHSGEMPKELQPYADQLVQEATARAFPGAAVGQLQRQFRYNTVDSWKGTWWYEPAKALDLAHGVPGPGHVMAAWRSFSRAVLGRTVKAIEVPAQQAHAGQFLLQEFQRESGKTLAKAIRFQGKAIDDVLKGMVETRSQIDHGQAINDIGVELGRFIDRRVGRYGRNSPIERNTLMFTPFGMWFSQSLKFIYATMPHEHPVITGIMAAANTATSAQRASVGLSGPLSGNPLEVPGYEEGGIPVGQDILAQQYYSPMGAITDLPDTVQSLVPLSAPLGGFLGVNYKGQHATTPGGTLTWADQVNLGVQAVAQMVLPAYSQVQTVLAGGAKQYDTSSPFNIQTNPPGASRAGKLPALENLFKPVRLYKRYAAATTTGTKLGLPTDASMGIPTDASMGISNADLGIP